MWKVEEKGGKELRDLRPETMDHGEWIMVLVLASGDRASAFSRLAR
jgi:hypothetical protein